MTKLNDYYIVVCPEVCACAVDARATMRSETFLFDTFFDAQLLLKTVCPAQLSLNLVHCFLNRATNNKKASRSSMTKREA